MGLWSKLGALAGAGIGTFVLPGVGTKLGATLGGGLGTLAEDDPPPEKFLLGGAKGFGTGATFGGLSSLGGQFASQGGATAAETVGPSVAEGVAQAGADPAIDAAIGGAGDAGVAYASNQPMPMRATPQVQTAQEIPYDAEQTMHHLNLSNQGVEFEPAAQAWDPVEVPPLLSRGPDTRGFGPGGTSWSALGGGQIRQQTQPGQTAQVPPSQNLVQQMLRAPGGIQQAVLPGLAEGGGRPPTNWQRSSGEWMRGEPGGGGGDLPGTGGLTALEKAFLISQGAGVAGDLVGDIVGGRRHRRQAEAGGRIMGRELNRSRAPRNLVRRG